MSYAVTLAEEFGGLKSLSRIAEALARITKDWVEKLIGDEDYQILSGFLHLKQKAVRETDTVAFRMPNVAAASRNVSVSSATAGALSLGSGPRHTSTGFGRQRRWFARTAFCKRT